MEYIINNSDASILIYGENFRETSRTDTRKLKKHRDISFAIMMINDQFLNHTAMFSTMKYHRNPRFLGTFGIDDLQMIMYTSGTTGLPKGVMFTHSQLLWSGAAQVIEYSYTQKDVTLLTGPLYHVGALVDLSIGTTNIGGTNIIMPSQEVDVESLLETIEREKVTNLLLFPVMLIRMFESPNLSNYDLSSLRFAIVGGERIDPILLKKFQKKWPKAKAYQAYGLTEGSEFTSLLDSEGYAFKSRQHRQTVF